MENGVRAALLRRVLGRATLVALLFLLAACARSQPAPVPSATTPYGAAASPEAEAHARDVESPREIAASRGPVPPASGPEPQKTGARPAPNISGLSAVVMDADSAAVLYEKDAHAPLPPASLTKIATAVLALERGDLDAWVDVDVDSRTMRGSTVMGLIPGDRFKLRDLLYGLMLPSGNDAALAIGRQVSGSDEAFVDEMNALATRLGLRDTHFANAHGLGGANHLISAYDLGLLSRYAMDIPGFPDLVTARAWTATGNRTIAMTNINAFLGFYAGADGIKTGYTRRAGSTLAASATRSGHHLYAIILNSPDRYGDARALLDWAFTSFSWPSQAAAR